MSLLAFEGVDKRFADGDRAIPVLEAASFELCEGESVGVRGAPGSGKTTLLKLAAGMAVPDRGVVCFRGRDLGRLTPNDRALLWRDRIVFVPFDDEGARRSLRAVEYVGMALLNAGRVSARLAQSRARRALERTEVLNCAETLMADLSQEDRLRVELSQALVREPALLLLDEPPVLRSPSRRMAVHRLLRSVGDRHRAVILASESLELLQGVPRIMSIGGGELREVDRPGEVIGLREGGRR